MKALVLEKKRVLKLRDIEIDEALGPKDLRVAMRNVGICGSDLHYYTDGRVGPFVVEGPLVLGHEGSGTVVEVGGEVQGFAPRAGRRGRASTTSMNR
jgi:D-xylulose reductase